MSVEDEHVAQKHLATIGYYRLGAYWLPFEVEPTGTEVRSKQFRPGTSFSGVIDSYHFDEQLRLLLNKHLARFEIRLRASLSKHVALSLGPHGHLDTKYFRPTSTHEELLQRLFKSVADSHEVFVKHYVGKYTNPALPPIWASVELLSFGQLSKWFAALADADIRTRISHDLGLPTEQAAVGTIQSLVYVRNICAHHGRLWNRALVKRPPILKRIRNSLNLDPENPSQSENLNLLYNLMTSLVDIEETSLGSSEFKSDWLSLARNKKQETLSQMGFREDWRSTPVWSNLR